ncbi:MAG TPA: hypothetical protein PKZ84_12005 [Anaerolineae bacterium]|nr:hypothetical protein [Anaerolineae bacterium]HQI85350.1 hypothetical protein [Anaerolineae bacterium]
MAQPSSVKRFSRAERVYRALLWVYPADFRREYEAPMAQLFRDLCRDVYSQHGRLGLAQMWGRVLADTAIAAVIERIYTLHSRFVHF